MNGSVGIIQRVKSEVLEKIVETKQLSIIYDKSSVKVDKYNSKIQVVPFILLKNDKGEFIKFEARNDDFNALTRPTKFLNINGAVGDQEQIEKWNKAIQTEIVLEEGDEVQVLREQRKVYAKIRNQVLKIEFDSALSIQTSKGRFFCFIDNNSNDLFMTTDIEVINQLLEI